MTKSPSDYPVMMNPYSLLFSMQLLVEKAHMFTLRCKREIYIDSSHGGLMTMAGVQNPSVQNQQ